MSTFPGTGAIQRLVSGDLDLSVDNAFVTIDPITPFRVLGVDAICVAKGDDGTAELTTDVPGLTGLTEIDTADFDAPGSVIAGVVGTSTSIDAEPYVFTVTTPGEPGNIVRFVAWGYYVTV